MTSDVRLVSEHGGGWTVTLGETSLAGFYGPNARQMAESHRDVLIEALARDVDDHDIEQSSPRQYGYVTH